MKNKPWFCSLPPDKARLWFNSRAGDIKARLLMIEIGEKLPMGEGQRILLNAIDHLAERENEARTAIQ